MARIIPTATKMLAAALLAFQLTACVSFEEAKPAPATLADFSGHYQNRPQIGPQTTALALVRPLEESLSNGDVEGTQRGGYKKLGSINIKVESDGSLRIEGFEGRKRLSSDHLRPSKDFTFVNSTIRLPLNQPWTNGDGPGLAFGLVSVHLMLDENRNLKVLSRSGAAGFVTIIPMAVVTRGVALHPRLAEKEWPPGYEDR